MFLAFFAVITSLIGSPACSVIVGLALPSILYWLSLSARISIVRSLVCAASIADIVNNKPIKQMAIALNASLRHVREDQFHIFIGQHGANAHVANDGAHHAWRELVRSLMAASAIRAIALFAFHPCDFLLLSDSAHHLISRRKSGTGGAGIFCRSCGKQRRERQ